MVPEAGLEETEAGLAPRGGGWFVLNARDGRWRLIQEFHARRSVAASGRPGSTS